MVEFFFGAAGMLLVIGAFFAGMYAQHRCHKQEKTEVVLTDPLDEGKTPDQIEADRRKLIAEHEAFQAMQNYNPMVAYRVDTQESDLP